MIKVIWPQNITFKYWASCLVADFPNENLPFPGDEKEWHEWATIVAGTGVFQRATIPSPLSFKEGERKEVFTDWTKWAKTVYTIMSDNYNVTE
jgi:hypothetical protein